MENFFIEEFTEYKIFLYDDLAHHPTIEEAIVIPYSSGKVYLQFYKGGTPSNEIVASKMGRDIFLYFHTDKFDRFVDILRHEKPLYIAVNTEKISGYITSEMEEVGEGDYDHS